MSTDTIKVAKITHTRFPDGKPSIRTIEWVDVEASSLEASPQVASRASGLTIVPTYDSTVTSHPQKVAIIAAIQAAIDEVTSLVTNNVTINITFTVDENVLGQSSGFAFDHPYANTMMTTGYYDALLAKITSNDDTTAWNTLPIAAPIGTGQVLLITSLARCLGFTGTPYNVPSDGTIFFGTNICNYTRPGVNALKFDLQTTIQHEINELMGTFSDLGGSSPSPPDLFRYKASGMRSWTVGQPAYFSIDAGTTNLANYNTVLGGDYGDWASGATYPLRVQDAFAVAGTGWGDLLMPNDSPFNPWITSPPPMTGGIAFGKSPELRVLDVIGWTLTNTVTVTRSSAIFPAGMGFKIIYAFTNNYINPIKLAFSDTWGTTIDSTVNDVTTGGDWQTFGLRSISIGGNSITLTNSGTAGVNQWELASGKTGTITITCQGINAGILSGSGNMTFTASIISGSGSPSVAFGPIGEITITNSICVHEDTLVDTPAGPVCIAELHAGDLCLDAAGRTVPLQRNVCAGRVRQFVRIGRGALGANKPEADLLISPTHPLLVNGREVIPEQMVDGRNVELVTLAEAAQLYTLVTAQRSFVSMQGLLVGTWSEDALENFLANDAFGCKLQLE